MNYILLLVFGVAIGVILGYVLEKITKSQLRSISTLINLALLYYLAWIFLIYGFSKIDGKQFPEIPIPDSAISTENQDLKFWVWLGSKPILVLVLGIAEISIGLSLFSEKMRKFGLLAYCISMSLILSVNAYFGIGVIVFALLLLFAAILAYTQNKVNETKPKYHNSPLAKSIQLFIAFSLVILAIFHQTT